MQGAFFKAATWRVISMFSATVTGLYALWLYTSYIELATYGVVAFALTVMLYLPFLDGGFRMLLNRRLLIAKSSEEREQMIQFGQSLYLLLGLVFILIGVVLMGGYAMTASARNSGLPTSFFLTLGFVNALTLSATIQSGLLFGIQEPGKMYIVQTLGSWLLVDAMAWGFARGWGVWAFPFSALVAFVVVYPLTIRWIKQSIPAFRWLDLRYNAAFWKMFSDLKLEAWHCCRMQLTQAVLATIDLLVIGTYFSKAEFAAYYVLARLTNIVRGVLQTGGEVGWPFFARREERCLADEMVWVRLHSWIYGAVVGALAATLLPFCVWYMGKEWAVGSVLLWLVVVRLLVSGVASGVVYLYYGSGDFKIITRCLEREVMLSLVIVPFGAHYYGLAGVAGAFLIGAVLGTGLPVFWIYTQQIKAKLWPVLVQVWARALLGFGISYAVGRLLLMWSSRGILTPFAGMAAVLASLGVVFLFSASRGGWSAGGISPALIKSLARKV